MPHCEYFQVKCCGVNGYDDWNKNIYFNCSFVGVYNPEKCGVPFSCCKNVSLCIYINELYWLIRIIIDNLLLSPCLLQRHLRSICLVNIRLGHFPTLTLLNYSLFWPPFWSILNPNCHFASKGSQQWPKKGKENSKNPSVTP